jgi:hypothetical protein
MCFILMLILFSPIIYPFTYLRAQQRYNSIQRNSDRLLMGL